MAQANICDRCGTVYKQSFTRHRYHIFDSEKNCIPQYTGDFRGVKVGEMIDLCDECSAELKLWIEDTNNGKL